jgi:hypothetical protein
MANEEIEQLVDKADANHSGIIQKASLHTVYKQLSRPMKTQ